MDANQSSSDRPDFSAKGLVRKWSRYFGAISGLSGADVGLQRPSQTRTMSTLYSASEPQTIIFAPSSTPSQPSTAPSPSEPLREDMGGVQDTPEDPKFQKEKNQCQKWINIITNDSPLISFMTSALNKAGCPFDKSRIVCMPCDGKRTGGYSPEMGLIVVCQNALLSKSDLESTLAHEMIHSYDDCTTNLSPTSCLHMACTEIRASSLSGECGMWREMRRGNWTFTKGHQKCVKRRAVLSLKMRGSCAEEAERWVEEAWESCFADTAPFNEIYP